jgi:hypothetical protein
MLTKIISENFAGRALTVMFSLIILFHLAVIFGFVPIDVIWGGRLKTQEELYVFESISLVLNALMLWVILLRMDYLKSSINPKSKAISVILWLMFCLFLLNTIGNLMAFNNLETYIFTPITLLLAIFSLRLAIKP